MKITEGSTERAAVLKSFYWKRVYLGSRWLALRESPWFKGQSADWSRTPFRGITVKGTNVPGLHASLLYVSTKFGWHCFFSKFNCYRVNMGFKRTGPRWNPLSHSQCCQERRKAKVKGCRANAGRHPGNAGSTNVWWTLVLTVTFSGYWTVEEKCCWYIT